MENLKADIEIKNLFKRQKIKVFENKIMIFKKSLTSLSEYEIGLDEIQLKKTVNSEANNNLMALGFLVAVFGLIFSAVEAKIIFVLLLILSLSLILIGFLNKKNKITILSFSSAPIVLEFNRSNEKEIREFSDKIISISKEYLIAKHSKIDKDLPFESQLNGIEFLRNNNLISDNEFDRLKNILLGKEKSVGFEKG